MKKYFIITLLILFNSCQSEKKFNKLEWTEKSDLMQFPNRNLMINDLISNYPLKGKLYRQITELLGPPQSDIDSSFVISYDVDIDYGTDIDPIYTKSLVFSFTKDSLVHDYKVIEWKK